MIPGTTVRVLKFAPLGDPIELMLRGYHLTLRKEEASFIEVTLK
ncbi:MAG TPA: FeoA family protein [Acidobacteriota bacterium]|nr:FeoA family protein [Acidobacteriota bacterium]